ncbi:MAG: Mth938-like domain-containing protein [Burkholderiaceae bacterium]
MKLHALSPSSSNAFTGYGDGYVEVNAVRFEHSVLVVPDRPVIEWTVATFEELSVESFAAVAAVEPEVVVFGSGARLRFPHPRLTAPLISRGIGVETMDVHAACRTYNILMAEGRKVAAVLLIEAAGAAT